MALVEKQRLRNISAALGGGVSSPNQVTEVTPTAYAPRGLHTVVRATAGRGFGERLLLGKLGSWNQPGWNFTDLIIGIDPYMVLKLMRGN